MPPVPETCSIINTPWPITLEDARDVYKRKQPHSRYVKRMRISGAKSSLSNFVIVKPRKSGIGLSPEAIAEGVKRREEYIENDEICEPCNRPVIFDSRQASCVCSRCGNSKNHNPPDCSYREGTSLHQPYLYKQSNHFRDHLKRIQGKESTEIPQDVLDDIYDELDKHGDDRSDVTPENIRLILKSLDHSKYYNHTMRIWSMATGKQPPSMTPHQEQELLHMFTMIQEPWARVRPKGRSNMLSYTYLLKKLCLLLGYDDLAEHFKTLKSRDKVEMMTLLGV
jgi:hypothetical protein